MERQLGRGGDPTCKREGIETVGREDVGVQSEGKSGFKEVGVEVGAGIGAGIETKGVGLTGENEGMHKAREVRLGKLGARKELGWISAAIVQKGKELVRRQVTKELGWTKGLGKADRTRHAQARGGTDAHSKTNRKAAQQGRGEHQQR